MPMVVIATWAQIDNSLAGLLAAMLHSEHRIVVSMLDALRSSEGRRAAIEAGVKSAASADDFDMFRAIQKVTKQSRVYRNAFAHGLWAYTPQIADALLLVKPSAVTALGVDLKDYLGASEARLVEWRESAKVGIPPPKGPPLPDIDRSRILVFRRRDLEEEVKSATDAYELTVQLASMLAAADPAREKVRQRLLKSPQIAELVQKYSHERTS